MAFREDLQRRIDRKLEEIKELDLKLREEQAYLQGLQDTLKMLPREAFASAEPRLRPGTDIAKARDSIRKAGHPLHISELLKAIGKPFNKSNRAGLSGNLAAYVRREELFTRPAPNTFGLVEFERQAVPGRVSEPPQGFGQVANEVKPEGDPDEPF